MTTLRLETNDGRLAISEWATTDEALAALEAAKITGKFVRGWVVDAYRLIHTDCWGIN